MARFHTKPEPVELENLWYHLKEDLIFEFTLKEALGSYPPALKEFISLGIGSEEPIYVIVPEGFVTDLASIPLALTPILPRDGLYRHAAMVHDMVYQSLKENTELSLSSHNGSAIYNLNKVHTRYLADRLFLLGMRASGVNAALRGIMYNGVRAGGDPSYGKNKMDENYGLDITHSFNMASPYLIFRDKISKGVDSSIYDEYLELPSNCVALKYPNLKRHLAFFEGETL